MVKFMHILKSVFFFFLILFPFHLISFHFRLIAALNQVLNGCRIGRWLHIKCSFHITLGGITGLISLKGIVAHDQAWKGMNTKKKKRGNVRFKKKS